MVITEAVEPAYAREVLPAFLLAGGGFGMTATTLMGTAATALSPPRAATASAVVKAGRQLSSNFGVAIMVTVIGTQPPLAQVGHLFSVTWLIGAALALDAAVICLWLPNTPSVRNGRAHQLTDKG
jgi:hypothetical protein